MPIGTVGVKGWLALALLGALLGRENYMFALHLASKQLLLRPHLSNDTWSSPRCSRVPSRSPPCRLWCGHLRDMPSSLQKGLQVLGHGVVALLTAPEESRIPGFLGSPGGL